MFFSDWFGPSLARGAAGEGRVAITFDDGPSESTPAILEALAEHRAKGTFFLVGANVERLTPVAQRVARAGHEIGNHTYSHPNFYRRAPWQVSREIGRCSEAIASALGAPPRLFRPPYGVRWFGMFPELERRSMRNVMWSVDTRDWMHSADRIAEIALTASDGDVILMHDGFRTHAGDHRAETGKALRVVLKTFTDQGLRAVTISELFGL